MVNSNAQFPTWDVIKSISSNTNMNLHSYIDMNKNINCNDDSNHYLGEVMSIQQFFAFCST